MIRLTDKELKNFISSFKKEIISHWKDNTLNQVYGYEIIEDMPPYSMQVEWNNNKYLLFEVDSSTNPNIGFYISKDTFLNSFEVWINLPDKDTEDLVNLKFIIDNSNISIQSSHDEWGEDMFELILIKYIDWLRDTKNNGAINLIPLQLNIVWKK